MTMHIYNLTSGHTHLGPLRSASTQLAALVQPREERPAYGADADSAAHPYLQGLQPRPPPAPAQQRQGRAAEPGVCNLIRSAPWPTARADLAPVNSDTPPNHAAEGTSYLRRCRCPLSDPSQTRGLAFV